MGYADWLNIGYFNARYRCFSASNIELLREDGKKRPER